MSTMFGTSQQNSKNHRKKVQSVVSWAVGFEKVLEDPSGLRTFTEFLKREFSAENIMFWIACKQYNQLTEKAQMKSLAKEIYDRHLRPGAPEAVNINSHTRQFVINNMRDAPRDLFMQAQKEIFILMKFDCYQRFLKSELFTESLTAEKLGKPLPCREISKSPLGSRFRSKSRDRNRVLLSPKNNLSRREISPNKELNDVKQNEKKNRKSLISWQKELSAVWSRTQRQLDDQRGTEIQCELPAFLRENVKS